MQPEDANIFQVLVRVPDSLVPPLQRLSGSGGVYVEPRQAEGRGTDASTSVVWLQNSTLAGGQHKLRITEKGIAVARFGNRYPWNPEDRSSQHAQGLEMEGQTTSTKSDVQGMGWLALQRIHQTSSCHGCRRHCHLSSKITWRK